MQEGLYGFYGVIALISYSINQKFTRAWRCPKDILNISAELRCCWTCLPSEYHGEKIQLQMRCVVNARIALLSRVPFYTLNVVGETEIHCAQLVRSQYAYLTV
jgi:hypothetical protein